MASKDNEVDRESCLFYRSFFEAADEFGSREKKLRFLECILDYGTRKIEPDFSGEPLMKLSWIHVKPLLDANISKYLRACKGGAPSGNQNAKKKNNLKQPKNNLKQPNENGNVNDNANDNANVNDNSHHLSIESQDERERKNIKKDEAYYQRKAEEYNAQVNEELRRKYGG